MDTNIKAPKKLFEEIPIKTLKFPSLLWFKFQWYKHIKRFNIVGFYDGIPIIASENLEEDKSD